MCTPEIQKMIRFSYIYVGCDKLKVIVSGAKYFFVIAAKVLFGHISANAFLLHQFFMTIIFVTNNLLRQQCHKGPFGMSALPTKKLLQNAFAYNSENLPGGFNDSLEVFIKVKGV